MQNSQPIFPKGIRINESHPKAPKFVKGNIGIKVDEFVEWLQENQNEKGWVNLDLQESRKGTLYMKINTYARDKSAERKEEAENVDIEEAPDIPIDEPNEEEDDQITF
jgi:hypothetical protein